LQDKKTYAKSIWKTLGDSWVHWFHLVYVICWVAASLAAGWVDTRELRILVAYIGLFVYVLVLMGLFLYFIASYSRKARYSEAVKCVHSAMQEIRNLNWYLDRCTRSELRYETAEVKNSLRAILDSVVSAYNIATAMSNRACLKILGRDGSVEYVRTLCRDSVSSEASKEKDASEGKRHVVNKNTDFSLIMRGERSYFLCANIATYPDYMNTSKGADLSAERPPYTSTLVLPVRHVAASDQVAALKENRIDLRAFLAVDAEGRGAYEERYDVDMGAAVADALYSVFMQMERLETKRTQATA